MKWGKTKYSDRRKARSLRRHVAASTKNLKMQGKLANEANSYYDNVYSEYSKELKRPSLSSKKKMERVDQASKKVSAAGSVKEARMAEFNRSKRIYEKATSEYTKYAESMISKYGSENIKSIRTKQINVGNKHVADVIKTGITVANLPLLGSWYTGRYISKMDYIDRNDRINDAANKRY